MKTKLRFPWPLAAWLLLACCAWTILRRISEVPPDTAAAEPVSPQLRTRHTERLSQSRSHQEDTLPLSKTVRRADAAAKTCAPLSVPGPPVGLLLADIDPSLLTAEEDTTLLEVQEKFVETMAKAPVSDLSSPEYHRQWKLAQLHCDDLLRLRLGAEGFNRMNFMAAKETERKKAP